MSQRNHLAPLDMTFPSNTELQMVNESRLPDSGTATLYKTKFWFTIKRAYPMCFIPSEPEDSFWIPARLDGGYNEQMVIHEGSTVRSRVRGCVATREGGKSLPRGEIFSLNIQYICTYLFCWLLINSHGHCKYLFLLAENKLDYRVITVA